jgi:ParB-like chromosome segregation protein Spo0J
MLEIKYQATDKLIPYISNSRTHSQEQVTQVAASIKEFGFTNPLLLDEQNGIIAGHGRLQAAKQLSLKEVPTITLQGLTNVQRKAYIIADNKLALNAGWDDELLALELASLKDEDFDLSFTGFDADELLLLIGDIDEVGLPELSDGDKEPFQQKTFTLHDEQATDVDSALMLARTNPVVDTGINDNSNGNALALICSQWLEANNANS